jgi:hypothetical protein
MSLFVVLTDMRPSQYLELGTNINLMKKKFLLTPSRASFLFVTLVITYNFRIFSSDLLFLIMRIKKQALILHILVFKI